MILSPAQIDQFRQLVWEYYVAHRRAMPWRETTDPYAIWVSELMLQQTQVERVIPKFQAFMALFPTIQALAAAPQSAVVQAWVGLGYNRRALYSHAAAQQLVAEHQAVLPRTTAELVKLPGIGPNTAGAIMAYAYNQPVVFVETNIRSVYIHHFYSQATEITDADIRHLLEQTIDHQDPRQWYWALMDYGTYLKRNFGNNIQKSRHYKKQSVFEGSLRQVRGRVIKALSTESFAIDQLTLLITDERLPVVLTNLQQEGLITIDDNRVQLAE